MLKQWIKVSTKWSSNCIFHWVHHPSSILVVNQTITKHTSDLMSPKSSQYILVLDFFLCAQTDTTNNFAHVTQVKSVVRFQWCWLEVFLDLLVNLQGGCNNLAFKSCNIWREVTNTEVPFKQWAKYSLHWVFIEGSKCDYIEMTLESRCDERFTTSGGSHSADD